MENRIWLTVTIACTLGWFTNSSTTVGQLVLNAGFENGTAMDADDWAELSGPSGFVIRSDEMPRTGTFSAHLAFDHINNPAAGAAYFIEQSPPANSIDSTQDHSLSFWAKAESDDFIGTNMFFQILWLDLDGSDGGGVQGELLTSLVDQGLNTEYQEFGFTDLDVPDSADSFLLRFQVAAGAVVDVANGMFIDDVVLSAGAKVLIGDVNMDGMVNLLDVAPFVDLISTGTFQAEADINGDGVVNLLDVGPFVDLLAGN